MKKTGKIIIDIILPFISGLIVSISFCFNKFAVLAIISLIPLLYSFLLNLKIYKIFIYSMTVYLLSLSWLDNSISRITDNPVSHALVFLFALTGISLILSVFMLLPFCIFRFTRLSKIKSAIVFPFIYIMGEWLQGIFYPLAFPWLRLGNTLSSFPVLIQSASVFGTLFISLLILYINIFSTLFIIYIRSGKKFLFILTEIIIIISDWLFGVQRLYHTQEDNSKLFSAAIVQGNYHDKSKCDPMDTLEKYIALSNSVKNKTNLILFPETSINSSVYENGHSKEKLFKLCIDHSSVLIFGSQYNLNARHYNACIVTTPEKEIIAGYFKKILVPYGEYNPVKISFLSFISSEFSPGSNNNIIKMPDENIGCVICFESIFSDAVRETVKKGAEVITVLTNDSWLGDKIPLHQHHSHSIMRAVENGRYVLTSANTGISSVISSKGEVIAKSLINKEYVINENYFLNNELTFYTRYGDIIILPSCFIIIFFCMSHFVRIVIKFKWSYFRKNDIT